jgi:hypothetical protein
MRCRPGHRQFAGYDDLVAVTDFNLARHRKLQAAPVEFHSRRASGRLLFAREILDVAAMPLTVSNEALTTRNVARSFFTIKLR